MPCRDLSGRPPERRVRSGRLFLTPMYTRCLPRRMRTVGLWLLLAACSAPSLGDPVIEPDASGGAGADADAAPDADAIVVPTDQYDQWVWVPIAGMVCGDGSPSGVGVRFTDASRNLVIWFQGNGVCYDLEELHRVQEPARRHGARSTPSHVVGRRRTRATPASSIADDATNPFRDDNFVVLPHCTVDGHTADKESTYFPLPTVSAARLPATRPMRAAPRRRDVPRCDRASSSPGSRPAASARPRTITRSRRRSRRLGKPSPFLIADSGPLMRDPYLSEVARNDLRTGWGLDATVYPARAPSATPRVRGAAYKCDRGAPSGRSAVGAVRVCRRHRERAVSAAQLRHQLHRRRSVQARPARPGDREPAAPGVLLPRRSPRRSALPSRRLTGSRRFPERAALGDPGWQSIVP